MDMSSGAEQQNMQPVPEAGRGLRVISPVGGFGSRL